MNQTSLTLLIGVLATAVACASSESRGSSPSEWRDTETTASRRREPAAKPLPEAKEKGDAVQPESPPCKDDVPMGSDPAPLTADEARIMAEALPLSQDTIDFNRIAKFFKLYRHIVETHQDPGKCAVLGQIEHATNSMNIITDKIAKAKQSTFSLAVGSDTVVRWLNDPHSSYASFVEHMLTVNEFAFGLVSLFDSTYACASPGQCPPGRAKKNEALFSVEHREWIAAQKSNYQATQRVLSRWKSDTDRVVGFKKNR